MSSAPGMPDEAEMGVTLSSDGDVECALARIAGVYIDPIETIIETRSDRYGNATARTLQLSGGGKIGMIVTDAGEILELLLTRCATVVQADGRVLVRSLLAAGRPDTGAAT